MKKLFYRIALTLGLLFVAGTASAQLVQTVVTDKDTYGPRETVHIVSEVTYNGAPLAGAWVTIQVADAFGFNSLWNVYTDANGIARLDYETYHKFRPRGTKVWQLSANAEVIHNGEAAGDTTSFIVLWGGGQ